MSVDVLAVLRAARDSVPAEQLLDYCAAVAAVAELIADRETLAQTLALAYAWIQEAKAEGVTRPADNTLAACRAALARVQGGA